ncbi:HAD-IB family phosphatase [Tahibacter amnicola]|uniref:HAD-IB family phosphatase n=1 Tax=Tahibacter amnicola TaxID=2976241 RepID=A0ABY6BGA4_9GAMM|nr:HAD-IB family phosphatase [Tahibacter amnicola]UXI68865.1 HAD-IB family phosphatase [Tahibacter amnicola]
MPEGSPPPSGPSADNPRIVLFDFDGVLIRQDSFETYLRTRLRRQPWRLLPLLPVLPALPLLLRTIAGKFWVARVFVRAATIGMRHAAFIEDVTRFGQTMAQSPGVAVHEAVACVTAHLAAGDRVLVVSGSLQPCLEAILVGLGLGHVQALGSDFVMGPFGLRPTFHNYGKAKLKRLATLGISAWDVAYSDSRADLPMLAAARQAILVNPDARDIDAVREVLGDRFEVRRWA